MPPTARFVIPHNIYAAVPAHRDVSYNEHVEDFVTLWVPFTDITEECGGVVVYKGSAKERPFSKLKEKGFWIEGSSTNGYQGIHCKMRIGDALLFNKWMLHRSAPNTSDHVRFSCDYRFFGSDQGSKKHYLEVATGKVIAPKSS